MAKDEKVETSHCTSCVYRVEVRVSPELMPLPVVTPSMVVDGQWRQLVSERGAIGVPARLWNAELAQRGFLSQDSALALGYWFLAETPEASVEFRVVEYFAQVDIRITRQTEGAAIKSATFTLLKPAPSVDARLTDSNPGTAIGSADQISSAGDDERRA